MKSLFLLFNISTSRYRQYARNILCTPIIFYYELSWCATYIHIQNLQVQSAVSYPEWAHFIIEYRHRQSIRSWDNCSIIFWWNHYLIFLITINKMLMRSTKHLVTTQGVLFILSIQFHITSFIKFAGFLVPNKYAFPWFWTFDTGKSEDMDMNFSCSVFITCLLNTSYYFVTKVILPSVTFKVGKLNNFHFISWCNMKLYLERFGVWNVIPTHIPRRHVLKDNLLRKKEVSVSAVLLLCRSVGFFSTQ